MSKRDRKQLSLKMKSESEGLDEGVLRFIASTHTPDRHDDTINQAGWVFEASDLPFLWAHDRSVPPIGKIIRRTVEDGQLILDVKFDMEDEFAADIYRKYKGGFMASVSVGFVALEAEPNDHGGVHFIRQELLELSAVPVPANPEATVKGEDGGDDRALFMKAQLEWAQQVIERSGAPQAEGLKALVNDLISERLDEQKQEEPEDSDEEEFFTLESGDDDEEQASFLESLQF